MISTTKKFNPLSVSSKFAICGLPLRLDSYKTCSFNCIYCFSNNRTIMTGEEKSANIGWLRRTFKRVYDEDAAREDNFLEQLLQKRITLHGGGMSDCFQPREEKEHVTRDIVDLCNEYEQHILFSTKSDRTYDVNLNPEYHSFQLSITNVNNDWTVEPNIPPILDRVKFYDKLKDEGYKVGIRLQPFIPEISDMRVIELFQDADHFTIEGLKLVPQNVQKNKEILETIGLCKEDFKQMGLLNLYPEVRCWYYIPLIKYFEEHGISYSIADNDLHYLSSDCCCCGDKLTNKTTTFNNTHLIQKYGLSYNLEDVFKELDDLKDCKCASLFTSNRQNGCTTVEDFYNERFTKTTSPFSPKFNYTIQKHTLDEWL